MTENEFNNSKFFVSTSCCHPQPHEVLDIVYATMVHSKSLVGDMSANFKNWTVGGELRGYSTMVQEAVEIALERIKTEARKKGADGHECPVVLSL